METFKTKVHKIECYVVDHDDVGADEYKILLENIRLPNHTPNPSVLKIETVEINYHDNHPVNFHDGGVEACGDLFKSEDKNII